MRQQEVIGRHRASLGNNLAVALRYVHKQIDRAIEDTARSTRRATKSTSSRNPGFEGTGRAGVDERHARWPKAGP